METDKDVPRQIGEEMPGFGSAFDDAPAADQPENEVIVISPSDLVSVVEDLAISGPGQPVGLEAYPHLAPPACASGESEYVGVARNVNVRSEVETRWEFWVSQQQTYHHQILTFLLERSDVLGNTVDLIPVEVSGEQFRGVLPTDGVPLLVHGRHNNAGTVQTYKVWDLRTGQALTVIRRDRRCFIATAVYTSPTAPQVAVLREWRDTRLNSSILGRALVWVYYQISPPIAKWLGSRRRVAGLVQHAFLDPLVRLVERGG